MGTIDRIALAQTNTTVGDFDSNLEKIKARADAAKNRGADLVCFPELSICGYPPKDLVFRSSFLEANERALKEMAEYSKKVSLIVGYASSTDNDGGPPARNTAAWLRDGEIVYQYSKNLLPTYDVFEEDRHFAPGAPPAYVEDLALTICEDIWQAPGLESKFLSQHYERQPLEHLRSRGKGVILNIAASPFVRGKDSFREKLCGHLAEDQGAPLLFCNQVGGNDSLVFDGNSSAYDCQGNLVAKGAAFEEDLLVVDTDELFTGNSGTERARGSDPDTNSEAKNVYRSLKLGLSDYLDKCGFNEVLLGLSGGIDSSLSATIAVDALGSENVLGILMPTEISSRESVEHARELANNLKIRTRTLPIQDLFENYLDLLAEDFEGTEWGASEENIQARIRGDLLMAFSNKFNRLLISTGNKSELAVGYCTLYGDMTGGMALLSDVPKTLVYRLSSLRNKGEKVIPEAVIEKPPSAELSPDQKDQDVLPPYEILDEIIERYVEKEQSIKQMVEAGLEEELVRETVRRIDYNEYKRQQAPVGLKVTSKSFSAGWKMPIAQKFTP